MGFKVSYGESLQAATGAYIFEEAKTPSEARRLFRETVKLTYGYIPKGCQVICSVVPLEELKGTL